MGIEVLAIFWKVFSFFKYLQNKSFEELIPLFYYSNFLGGREGRHQDKSSF